MDISKKTKKISKNENVPNLEIAEVVIVVKNVCQQDSRVLYIFVPNKLFGPLLDISPENFISLKTSYSELAYIEVWFTDQNSKPLDIVDSINITLVIN